MKGKSSRLFAPVQKELAAVEVRLHQVIEGQHESLTTATERLLNAGGKRLRPALSLLAARIFGADVDRSVSLAAAVEMLHTATLVHDDLIDGALLRRGAPTLNAEWAPGLTILTGDYLFARTACLVAETKDVRVMDLFARTLMTIVNGEIRQNAAKGYLSRDLYYERIYAKTAALFILSVEAAALLGCAGRAGLKAIHEFGRAVGMAFQIVDDILDFVGTPDQVGKPIGSDLQQGLFTLPAICYAEAHPQDADVRALLNGSTPERSVVSRVVAAVRGSDAIEQALQEAREFVARGQRALEQLPDSEYLGALSALSQFIVEREF
jgi:geranylgeranyl pyrophosphate synthase